jgi:hypothetical protein
LYATAATESFTLLFSGAKSPPPSQHQSPKKHHWKACAMQIPETPSTIEQLDLMKRLAEYGSGNASFLTDSQPLGVAAKTSSQALHSMLIKLEKTVAPLLDKVNAKEMDIFTAHDRHHAVKVAHLMWHIISPERRVLLTPPEIGLLVSSAFIHDIGMFLSNNERERRLAPDSDIWDQLEVNSETRSRMESLAHDLATETAPSKKQRLLRQLTQAQEALLCTDTRDRHATKERYEQIASELRSLHHRDSARIVDIDEACSYQGDLYLDKLIDICVSHNEPAESLVSTDVHDASRPRFPRDYPVGDTTADLQFVAGCLRLADILDFDRERTPAVLYYYFLPAGLNISEDRSAFEWSKHMSISHWHIQKDTLLFRGRCRNHMVHHGIIHFCRIIKEEILATLSIFNADTIRSFVLPNDVTTDIHAEGYTYVPYRFELDEDRIYRLLMGGSIYNDPLHAIRELLQNAVDACALRDALSRLYNRGMTPSSSERIHLIYSEPAFDHDCATLEIIDTGTGMDESIIRNWFLKVGRSYYSSADFNRFRLSLRKQNLDFAPVSEFGIGFLSTFLLSEQVDIETAMWEPLRGDTRKRILNINGPTRLIRLTVSENTGINRFIGTRVKLYLTVPLNRKDHTLPTWKMIRDYVKGNCLHLPYDLTLIHRENKYEDIEIVKTCPLKVVLPHELTKHAVRIAVDDSDSGLHGEIVLLSAEREAELENESAKQTIARPADDNASEGGPARNTSSLIRGGFRVGNVPGLPVSHASRHAIQALVEIDWKRNANRRYPLTNIARTSLTRESNISSDIYRIWLSYLLEHIDELPLGLIQSYTCYDLPRYEPWLERFTAYDFYRLSANGWHYQLINWNKFTQKRLTDWENSKGEPLYRGPFRNNLFTLLQDIILPRVCNLMMKEEAKYFLSTPTSGWTDILKGWKTFVSCPVNWPYFIDYIGEIKDVLYYEYTGSDYLNKKYEAQVTSHFSNEEIPQLIEIFRRLADSKKRVQVDLTTSDVAILRRAQETIGDVEISELFEKWRIDSFPI